MTIKPTPEEPTQKKSKSSPKVAKEVIKKPLPKKAQSVDVKPPPKAAQVDHPQAAKATKNDQKVGDDSRFAQDMAKSLLETLGKMNEQRLVYSSSAWARLDIDTLSYLHRPASP